MTDSTQTRYRVRSLRDRAKWLAITFVPSTRPGSALRSGCAPSQDQPIYIYIEARRFAVEFDTQDEAERAGIKAGLPFEVIAEVVSFEVCGRWEP